MGIQYTEKPGSLVTDLYYNPSALHSAPVVLLEADNALLHHFVDNSYIFSAANHPLPHTIGNEKPSPFMPRDKTVLEAATIYSSVCFAFSFFTAGFCVFLIQERAK